KTRPTLLLPNGRCATRAVAEGPVRPGDAELAAAGPAAARPALDAPHRRRRPGRAGAGMAESARRAGPGAADAGAEPEPGLAAAIVPARLRAVLAGPRAVPAAGLRRRRRRVRRHRGRVGRRPRRARRGGGRAA